jgi:hypothetical protein
MDETTPAQTPDQSQVNKPVIATLATQTGNLPATAPKHGSKSLFGKKSTPKKAGCGDDEVYSHCDSEIQKSLGNQQSEPKAVPINQNDDVLPINAVVKPDTVVFNNNSESEEKSYGKDDDDDDDGEDWFSNSSLPVVCSSSRPSTPISTLVNPHNITSQLQSQSQSFDHEKERLNLEPNIIHSQPLINREEEVNIESQVHTRSATTKSLFKSKPTSEKKNDVVEIGIVVQHGSDPNTVVTKFNFESDSE